MPEEMDAPGEAKPEFGTPGWLWKKVKYFVNKYVEGLIMAAITAAVAWGLALYFRPPVTHNMPQTSLGNHCAKNLFDPATDDGVLLSFDQEATRRMTVCGPGSYETGRMADSLRHYLTLYPQCFTATEPSDGVFEIKANLVAGGGLAEQVSLPNGNALLACRCFPEQIDRIVKENPIVCGVETR